MHRRIGQVLPTYGLQVFEPILFDFGVYLLSDLHYVSEFDLLSVGMSVVQARKLLSSVTADFRNEWGAATSVDETLTAQLRQRAYEKEEEAIAALKSCRTLACSGGHATATAKDCVDHALERLGVWEWEQYSRNAMLAFHSTKRGKACSVQGPLRKAFDTALKAVRDAVVWRLQLSVPWSNVEAFEAALAEANGGPLTIENRAQFLHSHSKVVAFDFQSAFLSSSKLKRRNPRPPKGSAARAAAAKTTDQDDSEFDQLLKQLPHRMDEYEDELNDDGLYHPGSHSSYPGSEICKITSEASLATGRKSHDREKEISSARDWLSGLEHNDTIDSSDTNTAPYFHHVKSFSDSDGRGILVLSELHKILVWMGNGSDRLDHTRPGATSLLSGLLRMPEVTFAIVSNMSYWHLLPATRKFLEEGFPGSTWSVEECVDGEWADDASGSTYKICDGVLSRRESEYYWHLTYESCDVCKVKDSYTNETWCGHLNRDGFLEWEIEGVRSVSSRVGRKPPTCLVYDSMRVFVLDKETVTEVREGQWVWRRKELDSAWSALSQSCCSVFDATNTILLDEPDNLSSHPGNVIPVPQWRHGENLRTMDGILGLIKNVVAERWTHSSFFSTAAACSST
jgi:hypothetical protein